MGWISRRLDALEAKAEAERARKVARDERWAESCRQIAAFRQAKVDRREALHLPQWEAFRAKKAKC